MAAPLITPDSSRHPCFNKAASGSYGRIHLPVAPMCNIRCNYCDRKFSCVNESRPGVTSHVLPPEGAVAYVSKALEAEPRISVAGIAGPGDPMANPAETLATLRAVRREFPDLVFCLSTNGLALPEYLDDLAEVGVSHVTVTMNAVDPEVGARIYSFIREGKVLYRGRQAAGMLLSRQIQSLTGLKRLGMTVKVNTIVMPGVNDEHVLEVSRVAGGIGADIQNLMPVHPTPGTPLGFLAEPGKEEMRALRRAAGQFLPQMTHCRRCRADAVGMLCKDRSGELSDTLQQCAEQRRQARSRPYVAVASREGMLVNQHLGEAGRFQIWETTDAGPRLVEERRAPKPGTGPARWEELGRMLSDCSSVIVAACGDTPAAVLGRNGLAVHTCQGLITDALTTLAVHGDLDSLKSRGRGLTAPCQGGGEGCGG